MPWYLWYAAVILVLVVAWFAVVRITNDKTTAASNALNQVEHDLEREEAQRLDARQAVAPMRRAEQRAVDDEPEQC